MEGSGDDKAGEDKMEKTITALVEQIKGKSAKPKTEVWPSYLQPAVRG